MKNYTTQDFKLGAVLKTIGHKMLCVDATGPKQVTITFAHDQKIYETIMAFHEGKLVLDPKELYSNQDMIHMLTKDALKNL